MKNIKNNLFILTSGLLCGLINGTFGSGGGTIAVLSLIHFLKLDSQHAHATAITIIFPLSILSSAIFVKNGYYDIKIIIMVSIGSIIGGIIGAKLLSKLSNKIIRKLFGIIMIISALRMMF